MKKKEPTTNTTSFWIAPLIVGSCAAIGYGLTQRIIIISTNWRTFQETIFESQKPFPGVSLHTLQTLESKKSMNLGLRTSHSQLFRALSQRSETEIRIVLGNLKGISNQFNEVTSDSIKRNLKIFEKLNEGAQDNFNNKSFEILLNKLPKP